MESLRLRLVRNMINTFFSLFVMFIGLFLITNSTSLRINSRTQTTNWFKPTFDQPQSKKKATVASTTYSHPGKSFH